MDENWKPITDIKSAEKNASSLSIRPEVEGDVFSALSGTLYFQT